MINKNLLICLLVVVSVTFLSAQSVDFEAQYHDNTIYLQQGLLGMKYIKSGKSYPLLGISSELFHYPESRELYKKYLFMRLLSLGVLLGGPIISTSLIKNDPGSFITISLGSLALGVFSALESVNKLNKAVWVYNRESLKESYENNGSSYKPNNWQQQESNP